MPKLSLHEKQQVLSFLNDLPLHQIFNIIAQEMLTAQVTQYAHQEVSTTRQTETLAQLEAVLKTKLTEKTGAHRKNTQQYFKDNIMPVFRRIYTEFATSNPDWFLRYLSSAVLNIKIRDILRGREPAMSTLSRAATAHNGAFSDMKSSILLMSDISRRVPPHSSLDYQKNISSLVQFCIVTSPLLLAIICTSILMAPDIYMLFAVTVLFLLFTSLISKLQLHRTTFFTPEGMVAAFRNGLMKAIFSAINNETAPLLRNLGSSETKLNGTIVPTVEEILYIPWQTSAGIISFTEGEYSPSVFEIFGFEPMRGHFIWWNTKSLDEKYARQYPHAIMCFKDIATSGRFETDDNKSGIFRCSAPEELSQGFLKLQIVLDDGDKQRLFCRKVSETSVSGIPRILYEAYEIG